MASPQSVALVVGASRGIGRQIAIDLTKNSYKGMFLLPDVTTRWNVTFNMLLISLMDDTQPYRAEVRDRSVYS